MSTTFFNRNGKAVSKDEFFREITAVFKMDRNEAREMVYANGVSWYELAEWQISEQEKEGSDAG